MNQADAARLIAGAVPRERGVWADIGCGDGTFTRALSGLLEPPSRIYAVDRDVRALSTVERWAKKTRTDVVTVVADFTVPFELPDPGDARLDGMLFANALHFARDASEVVRRLAAWLRPGGRVVIVEYDQRGASRWVPYPVPSASLSSLAESAGLSRPVVTATRSSAFGGELYAACARPERADLEGVR